VVEEGADFFAELLGVDADAGRLFEAVELFVRLAYVQGYADGLELGPSSRSGSSSPVSGFCHMMTLPWLTVM
jgi:hypothetical protein